MTMGQKLGGDPELSILELEYLQSTNGTISIIPTVTARIRYKDESCQDAACVSQQKGEEAAIVKVVFNVLSLLVAMPFDFSDYDYNQKFAKDGQSVDILIKVKDAKNIVHPGRGNGESFCVAFGEALVDAVRNAIVG